MLLMTLLGVALTGVGRSTLIFGTALDSPETSTDALRRIMLKLSARDRLAFFAASANTLS